MNKGGTKKMSKFIIFDMDGVIFDSERLVKEAWKKVGDTYGIPNVEDVLVKCIGANEQATKGNFLEKYGSNFPFEDLRQEASDLFHEAVGKRGIPMKRGVLSILPFLKEEGYHIGLASSTKEAVVREELKQVGIDEFFEVIIGGDNVSKSKPDPEIFLACCDRLGGLPLETYVIEDSYNGIRAAAAAGMQPIMVPDLLKATDEMRKLSCAVKEDLYKVMEYLKKEEEDE